MAAQAYARTYNQDHIPRKYTAGKRRISIYWTWSYPWEAQRDLVEMDNRFSTMTEVRASLGLPTRRRNGALRNSFRESLGRWSCFIARRSVSRALLAKRRVIPSRCFSGSIKPDSNYRSTSASLLTSIR
ncbi:MAG TPA: hypothetical protein VGG79_10270 [Roseiarcus sp.]|jgi:hypothetical protein